MILPVVSKFIGLLCIFDIFRYADCANNSGSAKKPNVLVIFADDVGTGDVPGYWNSSKVEMPNLQNLVSEGTTFTDAHSTPLCSPSRYMFLSGNYQHRGERFTSIWNLNYKTGQFKNSQMSIAELLRDNGYDTAMFGKWHLGGKVPTKDNANIKGFYAHKDTLLLKKKHDWTKPMVDGPLDIGFDYSYITSGGIQNPPYAFIKNNTLDVPLDRIRFWEEASYSKPNGISIIQTSGEGFDEWDSTSYNMILVNETKAFLDGYTNNTGKPFFAYVALGNVHEPHSPPYQFLDGSQVAGSYGTAHMDLLLETDKVVGALTQALQDRMLLEDTIIIFTSDNGGLGNQTNSIFFDHISSGPLKGHKGHVYEGGIRVPLTIRWDNGKIPKGETRSHLIGLNDLYKTICALVGVDVPSNQALDSISFADYALDKSNTSGLRKKQGAWTYVNNRLTMEALRYNEMKLIRNYQTDTYELYNLTADIGETNDISKGKKKLLSKMSRMLTREGPCSDREGKFEVTKIINNEISTIKTKCSWFRAKATAKRCRRYPEAQYMCTLTCAGPNKKLCTKDFLEIQEQGNLMDRTQEDTEIRLILGITCPIAICFLYHLIKKYIN